MKEASGEQSSRFKKHKDIVVKIKKILSETSLETFYQHTVSMMQVCAESQEPLSNESL